MNDLHHKITATHLARNAYLYVRQSRCIRIENAEALLVSTPLENTAVGLGWPIERVIVIDCFKRLVTEVSLGLVGVVLGLEVSRLARNSSDWHRLLELCALSDTLILDEDGLTIPHISTIACCSGSRER